MTTVTSTDGTTIGYTATGRGPALVVVDGALCHRGFGPSAALAETFAAAGYRVHSYDRRGRGASGDAAPYSPDREVEDLAAVIAAAGDPYVVGLSSGAALALRAANAGVGMRGLALYEAPFVVDDSRAPVRPRFHERMDEHLAAGRRGAALKLFMGEGVGVPAPVLALLPLLPAWRRLKQLAHTLPYDLAVMGASAFDGVPVPAQRGAGVGVPSLVLGGGRSPAWMRHSVECLGGVIPGARVEFVPGQTHQVKPAALVPVLSGFFR